MGVAERDELEGRIVRQRSTGESFEFSGSGSARTFCGLPGLGPAHATDEGIRPIGVNVAEREPRRPASDDALECPIPQVSVPQSVTVSQVAEAAADLGRDGSVDQLDADLVPEKRTAPGIVIAAYEPNADSGIDEIRQRSQGTEMPAQHDRAIFEPKVEQIAVDHEIAGRGAGEREKIVKRLFAGFRRGPEVGVGYDEARGLTHGQKYMEVR